MIKEIDGKDFYLAFLAGANNIIQNERMLNSINVFPVPDGDTGTNLSSTVKFIISQIKLNHSFQALSDSIASAALDGARGNSGIIVAQFLHGIANESADYTKINVERFNQIIRKAVKYPFRAIENPVEGTILTVLKDWSNSLNNLKGKSADFQNLLKSSLQDARKSLAATQYSLDVLKKNKVVDAGGQGFVLFLEGIVDFLTRRNVKTILKANNTPMEIVENVSIDDEVEFRYCTEALLVGDNLDRKQLHDSIYKMGDSLVIAGHKKKFRVHIHTSEPHIVMEKLGNFGELTYQKADDMLLQYEMAHKRKAKIALVTDSACDLPEEFLREHQVHLVPINLHVNDSVFLDKVSIKPHQFFKYMDSASKYPTTSHPPVNSFSALFTRLSEYYDSVISIHLSKELSGTWNAARKAAEEVSGKTGRKIDVINSRTLSGSLGLIVKSAAEFIASGDRHEKVVEKLNRAIENSMILVSVRTLKYMVKGGRVSPMKGIIARALNLKPIVSVDEEGRSILYDKAFSQKGNMKKVLKKISNSLDGRKISSYSIVHAENEKNAREFAAMLTEKLGREPDHIINISPVIALSAGKGAVAVSLIFE